MFLYLCKSILRGQTVARALFNHSLLDYSIHGKVLDVGGGRNQDYLHFLNKKGDYTVVTADIIQPHGSVDFVDFEKDSLPYQNQSIDQALMFNILEHIYNHKFLVGETYRVLTSQGTVLGFVPFLVNYHPDPHDYFRYTKEALHRIFTDAGFKTCVVKEIGYGSFTVNFNNISLSMPRFIAVLIFPLHYVLDSILIKLRPRVRTRYPLGYLFYAEK